MVERVGAFERVDGLPTTRVLGGKSEGEGGGAGGGTGHSGGFKKVAAGLLG